MDDALIRLDPSFRPDAIERLHGDIATLLIPSPQRALELDRAYWGIVREQAFTAGRDPVLEPTRHAHRRVAEAKTGIAVALGGPS